MFTSPGPRTLAVGYVLPELRQCLLVQKLDSLALQLYEATQVNGGVEVSATGRRTVTLLP